MNAIQELTTFPLAVKTYAFLPGMAAIPQSAKSAGNQEASKPAVS
jgi:hypothetical protein